eukprot:TRINITY_DN2869_c0_g2_i1.p1 TRINITY_DN2869_c0_g2~~TRINITY_DN2869_c0_g2_i1.p1  ORF type:complete len:1110 (-),score=423.97 TRINITY_DN2869_c0_g2_i1:128-3457(-)
MDIQQVLCGLANPNESIRNESTNTIENLLDNNVNELVAQLIPIIESGEFAARQLGAVILSRAVNKDKHYYKNLNDESVTLAMNRMPAILKNEANLGMKLKLIYPICQLAKLVVDTKGWPEIFPFVAEMCGDEESVNKQTGLKLLSEMIIIFPAKMTEQAAGMLDLFKTHLENPDLDVKIACLNALCMFLGFVEDKGILTEFQICIPAMFTVVHEALQSGDYTQVEAALTEIVGLAQDKGTFLRPHLNDVGNTMLEIARNEDIEPDTRKSAMNVMVSMCESAAGMMRKEKEMLEAMIDVMFQFLLHIVEADDSWDSQDSEMINHGGEQAEGLGKAGEEAFLYTSAYIRGKVFLPLVMGRFSTLLNHEDWRMRRAGLVALALIGDGCKTEMMQNIGEIISGVTSYFGDEHYRVRFAATHCLASFAHDFVSDENLAAKFIKTTAETVFPALKQAMEQNADHPRIRAHAAMALIQMCNCFHCKPSILKPVAADLLQSLFTLINSGHKTCVENAFSAVASISQVITSDFNEYYEQFLELCINAFQSDDADTTLRARAIECLTVIAQSVGHEVFKKDSDKVIKMLLPAVENSTRDDEVQAMLIRSFGRLCSVMKEDFMPYVEIALPLLLADVNAEVNSVVEHADASMPGQETEGMFSFTQQVAGHGNVRLSMDTGAILRKTEAAQQLFQYVDALGPHFAPHIEKVAESVIPMMLYTKMAVVRLSAVSTVPKLFEAACKSKNQQLATTILVRTIPNFLELIGNEEEIAFDLATKLHASECLGVMLRICWDSQKSDCPVSMPVEVLPVMVNLIQASFESSLGRRGEILKEIQQDEDFDEEYQEEVEGLLEEETELFINLTDMLGFAMKTHKDTIMPLVEEKIMPMVQEWLGHEATSMTGNSLLQTALCVLIDIVEFNGESSKKYHMPLIEALNVKIAIDDYEIKQTCVYGYGVLAEVAGDVFTPYAKKAMELLMQWISAPEVPEEAIRFIDNSISAVARFVRFRPDLFAPAEYFPAILEKLPLTEDLIESRYLCTLLLDSFELEGFTEVAQLNMEPILFILASCLEDSQDEDEDHNLMKEEDKTRFKTLIESVMSNPEMAGCVSEQMKLILANAIEF